MQLWMTVLSSLSPVARDEAIARLRIENPAWLITVHARGRVRIVGLV